MHGQLPRPTRRESLFRPGGDYSYWGGLRGPDASCSVKGTCLTWKNDSLDLDDGPCGLHKICAESGSKNDCAGIKWVSNENTDFSQQGIWRDASCAFKLETPKPLCGDDGLWSDRLGNTSGCTSPFEMLLANLEVSISRVSYPDGISISDMRAEKAMCAPYENVDHWDMCPQNGDCPEFPWWGKNNTELAVVGLTRSDCPYTSASEYVPKWHSSGCVYTRCYFPKRIIEHLNGRWEFTLDYWERLLEERKDKFPPTSMVAMRDEVQACALLESLSACGDVDFCKWKEECLPLSRKEGETECRNLTTNSDCVGKDYCTWVAGVMMQFRYIITLTLHLFVLH